jgi:hypothetical protein
LSALRLADSKVALRAEKKVLVSVDLLADVLVDAWADCSADLQVA